jgi:hypothetical protein
MEEKQWRHYFSLGLAIWFVLTSWYWTYFLNFLIAYPIAAVAAILWATQRKNPKTAAVYKVTGIMLLVGVVNSVVALFLYR